MKAVRYQIKHGAKVIKICATAGVLSFEGPGRRPADVARGAASGGRRGASAWTEDRGACARHRGNHRLERGGHRQHRARLDHDGRGGRRSSRRTADFVVAEPAPDRHAEDTELPPALAAKQAYLGPLAVESFKRASKYGLKVSFGTDAGVFPHGDNARSSRRASSTATRRCTRSGARRS